MGVWGELFLGGLLNYCLSMLLPVAYFVCKRIQKDFMCFLSTVIFVEKSCEM